MDPEAIPPETIVFGGEHVQVTHRDGRTESVLVRLCACDEYPAYYASLNNEYANAALVTLKDEAWARSLTPDSLFDVLDKGEALNFSGARRWAERLDRLEKAVGPLAEKARSGSVS